MNNVLEFKNVSMNFCIDNDSLEVLDDISFSVEDGEIVALIGPSGSGKSTILNLISKLITPSNGTINVHGDIGYMFQKDHLFEWRTIYKNVILGLEIRKNLNQESLSKVDRMLELYGLSQFKNHYPRELSGGMRQRVALIRTLAISPSILLLDEPFAALDYQTKIKVSNDIYDIIKKEKKATIMVTHDISEAISMADRIIVLSNRPARIKAIHNINFNKDRTPISVRKDDRFSMYFNKIWKELNDEE